MQSKELRLLVAYMEVRPECKASRSGCYLPEQAQKVQVIWVKFLDSFDSPGLLMLCHNLSHSLGQALHERPTISQYRKSSQGRSGQTLAA